MLNREQAEKSVLDYIDADKNDFVIIEEATLERDFGWVIFYDSRLHNETGMFRHAIAGNAPLIVERDTGRILETGTAYSIERYLIAYRLTGDPNSELTPSVEIVYYEFPRVTSAAIKTIGKIKGIGLDEAKAQIEFLNTGDSLMLPCDTEENARILAKEIGTLGFKCKITWTSKG